MKKLKKVAALPILICMLIVVALCTPCNVEAAKKKVKVVTEVVTEYGFKETFSYNKKGMIKKAVVDFNPEDGVKGDVEVVFSYNSACLLTKAVVSVGGSVVDTYTYAYDADGNRTTVKEDDRELDSERFDFAETSNNTCKYKKIKVDNKYVKKIKKQQAYFINGAGVENEYTYIVLGWG